MTEQKNKLVSVDNLESPDTTESLKAQLRALQDEEAALDLEIKREKVAKIRSDRQAKQDVARSNMDAIRAMMDQRTRLQKSCTHRKGGRGHGAVLNGQGTDTQFAVIRHMLPSGRLMILCQRCGQEEYSRDPIVGTPQTEQFQRFSEFPTDNQTSGSSLFLRVSN